MNIRKMILKKRKKEEPSEFLSTGSTQLNLAIAGKSRGGYPKGKYVLLVGDSESCKTFLSMTCLAEAAKADEFSEYRFVHDDPEDGASMEKARFFGEDVQDRLEPPPRGISVTVEDFYENLDALQAEGMPFIYILDSENALSSRKVLKRFEDNAEAHEKGQKEDESYGTEKAKVHSERLRVARNRLRETGSILIIISQTRDKIGAMAFQETKTRSGGRALRFFADVELWTSVVSQLTKTVKGKKRNVGAIIQIKVKKNRVTGKHRTIEVPFREDYGVDDTLGCINYLIEEGHWKGTEATVKAASEFGFNGGSKDDLIQDIESGNQLGKLRKLVTQVHREVEDALAPDRKKRYV